MDRVSESLSEHEERRESLQDTPPRYEILGEISRGGMGIVYRAWDPQLGREVALKVLRTEEGNTAEAHERFQREARLAAGLHHANIVPVYDTGTWNGRDYIAMQLIEGATLDSAKVDLRTALACVRDAARALHHAHEQGIVHRDIKPSNLLLDRQGRIFVTDFGVARQAQVAPTMTNPGTVVGTPAYMSPEQALGLPTDARSDVYSLGATIYEMSTGRPPYVGRDPVEIVMKVQSGEFDPPRKLVPDLSRNVEAIILGAMERTREERYASAKDLADDIERYLQGERPFRRPRGTTYKVRRQFARHPWRSTASIVFCGLLLLAGTALGYWIRGRIYLSRAKNEPDPQIKKVWLQKAGFLVPEASSLLAEILEKEKLAALALAKQRSDEEAEKAARELEEKQKAHREELLRKMREANDEKQRELALANLHTGALTALGNRSLPDARRLMEALKDASPLKHGELMPKLREVEFDLGVQELDRLASKSEGVPFGKLHAELSGEIYASQKDRSARLARPALALGRRLFEQARWAEAVKWCEVSEELGLREAALYEKRGLARVELKEWDLAERDFNRLLGFLPAGTVLAPRFAQIAFQKGRALAAERRYVEALKEFEISLRIDPTLAPAFHDRGLARFQAHGLAREAIDQDLKAALDLDPAMKPAREYRDVVLAFATSEVERHWSLDKEEERAAAWTRVMGLLNMLLERSSANDPDLLLERARMHRRLGNLPLAIEDARKAPGDAQSTLGILLYLQASRNKDPKAMGEAGDLVLSPYWKGLCLRYRGEQFLEPAVKMFLDPKAASAHGSLQLARTRLDLVGKGQEWRDAADDAARAIAAASTLTEAEYIGGLYELQKVSRSEAVRLLTRDAHLVRGQAGFEGSDYALCIEECKKALALEPRFSSAFLWRGYARCKAKLHRDAQDDFKETIRLTTHPGEKENASLWLDRCAKHAKE